MRAPVLLLLAFAVLFTSCAPGAEAPDPAAKERSVSASSSQDAEELPPAEEEAEPEPESSQEEEDGEPESSRPAWMDWVYLDIPITREQAGLDIVPEHAMNGHAPDEYWLSVADGSQPYTDEHFSWGVRHGMDFPFMRSWQRDMVLFTAGYRGEVLGGIRTGDAMSLVTERLGEPTQQETYRLESGEYDESFMSRAGSLPEYTFLHYKGNGFYASFMGRDSVEMIGLKRAALHDYDPDLLKDWHTTLTWHGDGERLDFRDSFFQTLNGYSWMGGTSVSNVGLIVHEYDSNTAVVHNDYQGNLYVRMREEDYDPETWSLEDWDYELLGVLFRNEDSNFPAFRGYMYQYAVLERMFQETPDTSPTGKYRLVYEPLRPYNYYLCFRSSDYATKDRLHTWVGGSVEYWLDDHHFLVVDMHGKPAVYDVERQGKVENEVMERLDDAYAGMIKDSFDRPGRTFSVWGADPGDEWVVRWSYDPSGELQMTLEE